MRASFKSVYDEDACERENFDCLESTFRRVNQVTKDLKATNIPKIQDIAKILEELSCDLLTCSSSLFGKRIIEAILIESGPFASLDVEILANKMNQDRSKLYRQCKRVFLCSPSELIRKVRLLKSIALLSCREINVGNIADSLGYRSPSYFVYSFKVQFGITPFKFSELILYNRFYESEDLDP